MAPFDPLKIAWRHRVTFGGYHLSQNRQARRAYDRILGVLPENALTPATRAEIRDYAGDRLGHPFFAPWLETYAAWRGRFVEGCIPDAYQGIYVAPPITKKAGWLNEPRVLFERLGGEAYPALAFVERGRLLGLDGEPADTDALTARIFADHRQVYVKEGRAGQGLTVRRLTRDAFPEALRHYKKAVVQAPITIHEDLQALSFDATPTLRITTVRVPPEPPRVVAAYLRLGRKGDSHVQSASEVRSALHPDGRLFDTGGQSDWTPVDRHPDSGIPFAGFEVPGYAAATALVTVLHDRLPEAAYIGWDVAIRPDATPILFEANIGHSAIKFSEACHGPIFAGLGWDRLHESW